MLQTWYTVHLRDNLHCFQCFLFFIISNFWNDLIKFWRTERWLISFNTFAEDDSTHLRGLTTTWTSSSGGIQCHLLACIGTALTYTSHASPNTHTVKPIKWKLRTLSLVSIWALFLCTILMIPGGWTHASPSTCTGTPSSPNIVIFTVRHWNEANTLLETTDQPENSCGLHYLGLGWLHSRTECHALPLQWHSETWQKASHDFYIDMCLKKPSSVGNLAELPSMVLTREIRRALTWDTNLCYPVMLQFNDPWYCHLHTVKHCDNF